jgi:hypothetical protein
VSERERRAQQAQQPSEANTIRTLDIKLPVAGGQREWDEAQRASESVGERETSFFTGGFSLLF